MNHVNKGNNNGTKMICLELKYKICNLDISYFQQKGKSFNNYGEGPYRWMFFIRATVRGTSEAANANELFKYSPNKETKNVVYPSIFYQLLLESGWQAKRELSY